MDNPPQTLIQRVGRAYGVDSDQATRLLETLDRRLREMAAEPGAAEIDASLDHAWHELILHTEYYTQYCDENFGRYLHHRPLEAAADRRTNCRLPVNCEMPNPRAANCNKPAPPNVPRPDWKANCNKPEPAGPQRRDPNANCTQPAPEPGKILASS
jgi:hypothetical protein